MNIQDSEAAKKVAKSLFTEITELVEVLAWPMAVVAILLIYKKYISGVISRVGSFKADASGISMTFQDKIEQAVSQAPKLLKSVSKSGVSMMSDSPNDQLKKCNIQLENDLKRKGRRNNIDVSNLSVNELADKLIDTGGLTTQKAKAVKALYELTKANDPKISQSQVDQVKLMVNELDL
ncbi:MAG: hypothetical protein HKN54_08680 [Flavobacteriaceae bacterium]|nr:hypothetical protein [Flavobacteriaceae bacterium]